MVPVVAAKVGHGAGHVAHALGDAMHDPGERTTKA